MTKENSFLVSGLQFPVSQFQPPIVGAFPSKPETRNPELETRRYQPLRSLSEVM
jgi:hypothetical protein